MNSRTRPIGTVASLALSSQKSADDIQLGLSSASFFIFLAEWILAMWCQV